jgi:TPR repeat protein
LAAAPAPTIPDVGITTAPFAADPSAAKPRLSAADAAAFLARGDALLSTGDLAAARLFYERAAEAGEAEAAIRLGETFDPTFLDHLHLRGIPGNVEAALTWYRRARDLGAAEAEVLLNSLQAK